MALPGAWPPPGNPKIAEGKIEKNRKPMQAKFLPAPGASPPASILDLSDYESHPGSNYGSIHELSAQIGCTRKRSSNAFIIMAHSTVS
jgi:hypothetical protein